MHCPYQLIKKIFPALLACVCLPGTLFAGVNADVAESAFRIDFSSTLGPMSDSDHREDDIAHGIIGEAVMGYSGFISLADDDDGAGPDFLDAGAPFLVASRNAYSFIPGTYLRIWGYARAKLSYTEDGYWASNPAATPSTTLTSDSPGCRTRRRFTVTDSTIPYSISGEIPNFVVAARVTLSVENTSGPETILHQEDTTGLFYFEGVLAPGNYWITAEVQPDAETGIDGIVDFDLEIGDPHSGDLQYPDGAYSYSGVGTELTGAENLVVDSPSIVSQVSQGNGTTLVTVTANLTNTSACPWEDVIVEIPATFDGGPDVTILPGHPSLGFADIEANATASPDSGSDTIGVLVADADLAAFNASILSGERFTTSGRELLVFKRPVYFLRPFSWRLGHPDDILSYGGLSWTVDRDQEDIWDGWIFMEDPDNPFPLLREIDPNSLLSTGVGGTYQQDSRDMALPFMVGTSHYNPDDTTSLFGYLLPGPVTPKLQHLISHGTLIETHDSPHPSGLDVTDGARGVPVENNHPVHFNRIPISDNIELSGSLFFKPGKMGLRTVIEDSVIKEFVVFGEFDAAYTLLIETKGPLDNSGEPLAAQETTLFSAPIFSIVLPSGITLTPIFSTDLGASIDASTALTIPIETKAHVSFTAGVRDGAPFYEQTPTVTPPALSPPALFQQLGATAEAWIKPQLEMRVGSATVGVGPTFGAKLRGAFDLSPGGSPWWTLEANLDLLAGVEFDLAGIATLFDAEHVLDTIPLFSTGAGGTMSALRAVVLPDNPGIQPEEGANTRWVRVSRFNITAVDDNRAFIFPVPGTTDLIAGGLGDLSRYAADGTLKWSLAPQFYTLIDAVPEDDEGFTVLGDSALALFRCDATGNRTWLTHLAPTAGSLFPIDLARRVHPVSGDPEYLVTGWFREFGSPDALVVIKFDHTGALLWSKKYAAVPADAENTDTASLSATLTAAGDLLVTGYTYADLAGATPLFNTPGKPLLMKISGDDGSVLWANALCNHRGGTYNHALESPAGEIYAGGACAVTVLDDIPPMNLSKFESDGTLINSIVIGSSTAEGADTPIYDQGPVPNGGETVFDIIRAMAWHDDHLWIGGTIGTGSADFGLSSGRGAFTARLTDKLALDRFALHEIGPASDAIISLADGGDGLLACGHTSSILPWPDASSSLGARLVMKLPEEGILRFHDISAAAQPARDATFPTAGSHYIYPRTAAGSDISNYSFDSGGGAVSTYPVSFTVTSLSLGAASFPPAPLVSVNPLELYQLDYVPQEMVTNLQTYLDYNQVDATEDNDGDGMDAKDEFFYGSNPFAFDLVTPLIEYFADSGGDFVVLTIPRSKLAAPLLPTVYDSGNLSDWFVRDDDTDSTTPLNDDRDWLHLSLPVNPGENQRFYQLETP